MSLPRYTAVFSGGPWDGAIHRDQPGEAPPIIDRLKAGPDGVLIHHPYVSEGPDEQGRWRYRYTGPL